MEPREKQDAAVLTENSTISEPPVTSYRLRYRLTLCRKPRPSAAGPKLHLHCCPQNPSTPETQMMEQTLLCQSHTEEEKELAHLGALLPARRDGRHGDASPGDWDTGYTQEPSLGTIRVLPGPCFSAR